jgi:hypothetical protein
VPGALPADWIDTSAITGDAADTASAFLKSDRPDGQGTGHPYGDQGMVRADRGHAMPLRRQQSRARREARGPGCPKAVTRADALAFGSLPLCTTSGSDEALRIGGRSSIIPTVADSRMDAAVSVCPAIRARLRWSARGWRSGGRFCFVLCPVTRLLARPHIFRRRCRLRYVFRRRSLLWTACRNSFGKLAHRLQLHSAIGYSQPRSPCSSSLEQPEHVAIIDRWPGRPARPHWCLRRLRLHDLRGSLREQGASRGHAVASG